MKHIFFISLFVYFAMCKVVTISNAVPRVDTTGSIMDVHDGNILYKDGVYYYYGAEYGFCTEPSGSNGCADFGMGNCGFQYNHNVTLFTSTDLSTWQRHAPVFQIDQQLQNGILFCPKIIYNKLTNLYVLWFNWITGSFSNSLYGVATSPSPFGPFKVINQSIKTLAFADVGDFNLFVDDDGQAYIIYTAHIQGYPVTHQMSVERLSPDYQTSLGSGHNSGFFGQSFVEAPAFFKRNGKYYAVFGSCCCYCGQGSPVTYYTANNPLGPYTQVGSLTDPSIPSQQTNILQFQSLNGTQYLWHGDRWQSAPDHLKGHDYSYFAPIEFDENGNPKVLSWQNSFNLYMP